MDDHRPAADVITGGLRPPAPRTLLGLQIAAVAILVG